MKKILIVSDDEQDNVINLIGSEALRIKSHCENVFSGYLVDVFTRNSRKNKKTGNINYLNVSKKWILKNIGTYKAVVLFQNSHFSSFTYKLAKKKLHIKTIIDLYNPLILEKSTYVNTIRKRETEESIKAIIFSGDFFLCANQKQKDYYLGALSVLGKTSDSAFGTELVAVIPTHFPVCCLIENFKKTKDFVFFGGVYPWFNKKEIGKFTQRIIKAGYNVTFFGNKNPAVKGDFFKVTSRLSQTFSKKTPGVFYQEWMPFERISLKLQNYKIAFNFVNDNLEDFFAYRTRFLSLLQSGVPIITNGKDEISMAMIKYGAGDKYDERKKISEYLDDIEQKSRKAINLFNVLNKIDENEKNKIIKFIANKRFSSETKDGWRDFSNRLTFFIKKHFI